ncbi:MAG TPA: chromosome segregation protein SMC [Bacillota bacterium]
MYLKRLDVFGFKSFADRIELELQPGVTAIVGPNGSGKSNIADSVRWALGEQSPRQLRGTKMEEVIFAGSSQRRSLSMAEVGLTIDNGDGGLGIDYNEVTVTRRVFRSGDGQYLINKSDCRLKDVLDLFSDTGVGKEGYSIIGQGQVENVLSSRWEDRRGIFEEAAGIVRYKNRKREAQRKLEETLQNLLRVGDVISATEAQLEPLEKQYHVAQLYRDYRTRLQALETQLYLVDAAAGRAKLRDLVEKAEAYREQAERATGRLAALETEVDAGRERLAEAEAAVDGRQRSLAEISEALVRLEGRRAVAEERLAAIERERAAKVREADNLRVRLTEVAGSLEAEDRRAVEIAAQLAGAEAELAARTLGLEEVEAGLGQTRQAVESLKGELIEALNEAAEERNRVREAEQMAQAAAARRLRLESEAEEGEIAQRAADENAAVVRRELDGVRRELAELRSMAEHWRKTAGSAATKAVELQREVARCEETCRTRRTRLSVLEEMESGYQGYGEIARRVLVAKKEGRPAGVGVLGSLADLIEVLPGHEVQVETALGDLIQAVVVETIADAERLAAACAAGEGRLLVLPLELCRRLTVAPARREAAPTAAKAGPSKGRGDGLGLGAWIRPRAGGGDLVTWLSDRYVITPDLTSAWEIVGVFGGRAAVTIGGEVVAADGVVAAGGGPHTAAGNPLERRRELADLTERLARDEDELAKVRRELAKIAEERQKADNELAAALETTHRLEIRQATGDRDLARAEEEAKKLAQSRQLLALEQQKLDRQEREAARTTEKARARLDGLKDEETAIREKITADEKGFVETTVARETLAGQVADNRVAAATLKQEINGLTAATAERRRRRQELEGDITGLEAEAADLSRQAEEVAGSRRSDEAEEVRFKEDKATAEVELAKAAEVRKAVEAGLVTAEKESRALRRQSEGAAAKLRSAEVEQARVEAELQRLRERLSGQYGLDVSRLEAEADRVEPPADRVAAEAEAEELRARIDGLGLVNLAAIDDFQRAKERVEFLKTQHADLEQARGQLGQLIAEIDEVMKKRFLEHFLLIKEQFSRVFQRLFGGGRAELILIDEGNLLETGIDILAQPPGKTLQNLSLLSGGEKALTAIALLFAVLEVKPSPFCLLDEIDAALDESNVERFARFLRECSRKTQFLIITHQKRTMEVADVLYGVTMEEGGVSKIVSVRLEEKAS